MKYPQVTEWSLERYRESLQERRSSVGGDSQEAIDRLIKTPRSITRPSCGPMRSASA